MLLNNRVYDTLKYVAQIVLPAIGALYFGLAKIWGLPDPQLVVGTITAVDVFLGVLLGISNMQYQGQKVVREPVTGRSVRRGAMTLATTVSVYDVTKWATLVLLPALGTLYFSLAELWGFPYGEEIVGTISVITAFMGIMLGVNKARYLNKS